jgi:dTDP-4-amino-4,6-dideoxygalactose transaminase
MTFRVPMSAPDITPADVAAVHAVLETPHLSMGPRGDEFEQRFAAYTGTAYAAGVNSGTSGLHLATIAAGVGPGDLAITTPFSFVASANCLLYEGAIPLFVDIDPETLNIDASLVARAAEDLARGGRAARRWLPPALQQRADRPGALKAILAVDVFGQPADYDLLRQTATQHGLALIEDACEAVGAEYKGRRAGTLGDVAVFAFYPNKQMTTGEGGVVVTDRQEWDALFRSLRNQGRDESGTWLNHVRLGYNYRLDEMSAALGLSQLARIEELLQKRERVAHMYGEHLRQVPCVAAPVVAPTTTRASWFVYVVRLAPGIERDAVMARLQAQGIACRPYFTPIHLQPFYVERLGYRPGSFPITEAVSHSTLALPFYNNLDEETVALVCRALRAACA